MGCSGSKLVPASSSESALKGSFSKTDASGPPRLSRLSIAGDFNQDEEMKPEEHETDSAEGFVPANNGGNVSPAFEYAYISRRGYYPDYPTKANQDAVFVVTSALGDDGQHIFGVMDGHGEFGADCAQYVRTKFPVMLMSDPAFKKDPSAALSGACQNTNADLRASKIDDSLSGTTACIAFMRGKEFYFANVGDSRAVIAVQKDSNTAAREDDGGSMSNYIAQELTSDQTPFREDERKRVELAGARVLTLEQLEGLKDSNVQCWTCEEECDGDPPRLWAEAGSYPGTAFTRSIGDSIAEKIGVTADPELSNLRYTPAHAFLIVASDGVWEFLPSQQAVDVIGTCLDNNMSPKEAAKALVDMAFKAWMKKENRTDDISVVVISFKTLGLQRVSRRR